jgi:TPP-dependent pyruvate/acetoin dehydrogenase alpha subunit
VGDLDADAKQTAVENLVDKAIGYGIPVRVDGGDVSRSMR